MQLLYNFEKNLGELEKKIVFNEFNFQYKFPKKQSRATQTDYRESETQTEPWEPPYLKLPGVNPEVLTLVSLRWDNGLPAGIHEIENIKRVKMKNAWKRIVSPIDCGDKNFQKFVIAMIDKNDWKHYEKEMQIIADIRMEKIQTMLEAKNYHQEMKLAKRFEKVSKCLNRIRDKKINEIKEDFQRKFRKLGSKYNYKSYDKKFSIEKPTFPHVKSESMKFKVENNPTKIIAYNYDIFGKHIVDDKQSIKFYRPTSTNSRMMSRKRPDELCIRQTRWTDDQFKELHADLKNIHRKMLSEKVELKTKSSKTHFLSRKISSS